MAIKDHEDYEVFVIPHAMVLDRDSAMLVLEAINNPAPPTPAMLDLVRRISKEKLMSNLWLNIRFWAYHIQIGNPHWWSIRVVRNQLWKVDKDMKWCSVHSLRWPWS